MDTESYVKTLAEAHPGVEILGAWISYKWRTQLVTVKWREAPGGVVRKEVRKVTEALTVLPLGRPWTKADVRATAQEYRMDPKTVRKQLESGSPIERKPRGKSVAVGGRLDLVKSLAARYSVGRSFTSKVLTASPTDEEAINKLRAAMLGKLVRAARAKEKGRRRGDPSNVTKLTQNDVAMLVRLVDGPVTPRGRGEQRTAQRLSSIGAAVLSGGALAAAEGCTIPPVLASEALHRLTDPRLVRYLSYELVSDVIRRALHG